MEIAWLFPGQGSQRVGMGRELFRQSRAARHVLAQAECALDERLSWLMFDGPQSELELTANAQPALLTLGAALVAELRMACPRMPEPRFVAGHSLGEYSALVAAGALGLTDAVRLVRVRGRAMQLAVPPGQGAMAAVMGVPEHDLRQICEAVAESEVVSCANFNGGQIVVAGHAGAVQRVIQAVEGVGKAVPLPVSAPFHCSLMRPAAQALAEALDRTAFGPFRCPVISNVTGEPYDEPSVSRSLLTRQVESPVRWDKTVAWLAENRVTHALELGAGVLKGICRRLNPKLRVLSIEGPIQPSELEAFLGMAVATSAPR